MRLDWHWEDIKAALRKRGTNMRQVAIQHGYSDRALIWAKHRPYPAAERIIAAALGLSPRQVWPSRYDSRGNSLAGRKKKGAPKRKG